jgi:hypothetical protein
MSIVPDDPDAQQGSSDSTEPINPVDFAVSALRYAADRFDAEANYVGFEVRAILAGILADYLHELEPDEDD